MNAKRAEARASQETDAAVVWLREGEPSPGATGGALRIAPPATDGQDARPMLWRRVVAVLAYDNRLQPRPAGARAVGVDQLRLLYQAGALAIDLEVVASSIEGRLRMLGEVPAEPVDLARAWVAAEGPAGRIEDEIDELGQFVLDGLVPGHHRVEIGLTYELIEIPDVRI